MIRKPFITVLIFAVLGVVVLCALCPLRYGNCPFHDVYLLLVEHLQTAGEIEAPQLQKDLPGQREAPTEENAIVERTSLPPDGPGKPIWSLQITRLGGRLHFGYVSYLPQRRDRAVTYHSLQFAGTDYYRTRSPAGTHLILDLPAWQPIVLLGAYPMIQALRTRQGRRVVGKIRRVLAATLALFRWVPDLLREAGPYRRALILLFFLLTADAVVLGWASHSFPQYYNSDYYDIVGRRILKRSQMPHLLQIAGQSSESADFDATAMLNYMLDPGWEQTLAEQAWAIEAAIDRGRFSLVYNKYLVDGVTDDRRCRRCGYDFSDRPEVNQLIPCIGCWQNRARESTLLGVVRIEDSARVPMFQQRVTVTFAWRAMVYLLAVATLLVALAVMRMPAVRVHRRNRSQCIACGYNLAGNVTGRCSECGKAIA